MIRMKALEPNCRESKPDIVRDSMEYKAELSRISVTLYKQFASMARPIDTCGIVREKAIATAKSTSVHTALKLGCV
jgi:hypothetical protein